VKSLDPDSSISRSNIWPFWQTSQVDRRKRI